MTTTYVQGSALLDLVRLEVAPTTGSTTTMLNTQPYNMVVFTNSASTSAQTLLLPASPVDGQLVYVTWTSIVASMTIFASNGSSTVSGFTNTSATTAGSGHLLMYSSTLATPGWFVVM